MMPRRLITPAERVTPLPTDLPQDRDVASSGQDPYARAAAVSVGPSGRSSGNLPVQKNAQRGRGELHLAPDVLN